MQGIFVRNDGIMVRVKDYKIDYRNGEYRLHFYEHDITIDEDDFHNEFPIQMSNSQIINLIQSGVMTFHGETQQESIDFFTK